jgi:hypothetical protein
MQIPYKAKLDSNLKKRITADWSALLPGYKVFEPMYFLRRSGAVLLSISLEPSSGHYDYLPAFGVTVLGTDRPLGSASVVCELRTASTHARKRIKTHEHDKEHPKALEWLRRNAPLPLEGSISRRQVVAAYWNALGESPGKFPGMHMFTDLVMLDLWCSDSARALATIKQCVSYASKLSYVPKTGFKSAEAWAVEQSALIERSDNIRVLIERELVKKNLRSIPTEEFSCW